MLGSQRSPCHDRKKLGVVDSSEGVGREGRMPSTTDRYRARILDGHRDRWIREIMLFIGQKPMGKLIMISNRRLRLPRHSHGG